MSKPKKEKLKSEEVIDETAKTEVKEDKEPTLEEQLELSKEEATKNYDLALRTQAEMENMHRRAVKDVENAHKFALERFAKELLNVADSIDLGLNAADDNSSVESLKEGMQLTRKQFFSVLEKFEIETIDADGAKFDPEFHEAVTMVPNSELEPNTIMEVVQKGYILNGRVIRASKVVVSAKA